MVETTSKAHKRVRLKVLVKVSEHVSSSGQDANSLLLPVDFDDEDHDIGFGHDKDMIKNSRQQHEVEFSVFAPVDIQTHQNKQIDEVSAILQQPPEASAILLRHLRWNKERLIEGYMDNPEIVLASAGLGSEAANAPKTKVVPGFMCDICCEDGDSLETYALKCEHRYCVDCYRQYLAKKIQDEGEAARIQCPTSRCTRIVDAKSLDLLVTADLKSRYIILKALVR